MCENVYAKLSALRDEIAHFTFLAGVTLLWYNPSCFIIVAN